MISVVTMLAMTKKWSYFKSTYAALGWLIGYSPVSVEDEGLNSTDIMDVISMYFLRTSKIFHFCVLSIIYTSTGIVLPKFVTYFKPQMPSGKCQIDNDFH